jgi:hypothetical protein
VISKDMKFILKTLSIAEYRLLFSFLPAYLEFVRENVCGGGGRRGRPMSSLRRESEGEGREVRGAGGKADLECTKGERGKGRQVLGEGGRLLKFKEAQGKGPVSNFSGRTRQEGAGGGRIERGEKEGRAKPDRNTVLTNF